MLAPIPATKFYFPPLRRNFVSRPRLVRRLVAGLAGPLTLVSAPPGSGKTTLLSEWRAGPGQDAAAAWLSLDASDNDPARFLDSLITGLGTLKQGMLDGTALLLRSGQPAPPDAILNSLVNELSTGGDPGDMILILDDYHVITTPAIHDAVASLLAHLPPALHLAILSREDPPLPLSRLRVRGHLAEIRERDLQFTLAETATFLTVTMGLELSESEIAGLAERTEGWAAALQIAGLSLQNREGAEAFIAAFRGDDRYVMDYLMDEVLRRQPPEIQDFLLQASILESLSAPLCDAIIASPEAPPHTGQSQAVLERLERANLFVHALDNRRAWYRFHHLFADLLRYALQRTYPERLPELHRRASRWYGQAGDPDQAMAHALAIPDPVLAADLAEQYMLHMTGSSRMATYMGWIQQLPPQIVLERAYLCVGCGWTYALLNQAEAARRYVDAGLSALAAYKPVFSAPVGRYISREEVAGNLAAIHAYVDRLLGDLKGSIAHAQEALDILPPEAQAVRCAVTLNLGLLYVEIGDLERARQSYSQALEAAMESRSNVYVANTALSELGGIAAMQGKLREAEGFFHRALRYGTDEAGLKGPIPSAGLMHGWLMWLHCQRNEIDVAQQHLDLLLESVGQMGIPEATARAHLYQARLCCYRGEMARAGEWFARVEALLQSRPRQGLVYAEWIAFRGDSLLWQGDLSTAIQLLETHRIKAANLDRGRVPHLGPYVVLARVLAAQDMGPRTDALLERICDVATAAPAVETLLQALALRGALAGSLRGAPNQGITYLERALDLAAPEGFARPILDAGGALPWLLRQAIMRGIQPAFAHKLLARLVEEGRWRNTGVRLPDIQAPPGPVEELVDPPTERETQVLRLLAAGLSSSEVAGELVISVNTARSYIKSLYSKLDAHSREEAIEKGKQFGLI